MAKDHYAILGVSRTATREEIQTAYQKMAQLYSPDVTTEAFAANIYQKVTEAWNVLTDEEQRRAYDARLAAETAAPSQAAPVRPSEPLVVANAIPNVPEREMPLREAPTPMPEPDFDRRAFYAAQFRAEKQAVLTFQDWLSRKEVAIAVAGSMLLIDILAWLFGSSYGGAFGFLGRSSGFVLVGWAGYFGLRRFTDNVFFSLGYSLFYAVIYAVFLARIHFDPALDSGLAVSAQIGRQISVYFIIFYVLFFGAAQSVEEGGLKTLYDRAMGRK